MGILPADRDHGIMNRAVVVLGQPVVVLARQGELMMAIDLVECVRPAGERYWQPFGDSDQAVGFSKQWWHRGHASEGHRYFRAFQVGIEVGRLDLDSHVAVDHYANVPPLGGALEIQFIEVRMDRRGEGLGKQVIEAIVELFPSRRLVAFSMEADGFYERLGWSRHLNSDQEIADLASPLYVQPAGA